MDDKKKAAETLKTLAKKAALKELKPRAKEFVLKDLGVPKQAIAAAGLLDSLRRGKIKLKRGPASIEADLKKKAIKFGFKKDF